MGPRNPANGVARIQHEAFEGERGQALAETLVALPVLLCLFAGCVQFVQIGIAHAVVRQAAFEGGRAAYLRGNDLSAGARVARELCRAVGPGRTEFTLSGGAFHVTHELQALFPVIQGLRIHHACPATAFQAGEVAAP